MDFLKQEDDVERRRIARQVSMLLRNHSEYKIITTYIQLALALESEALPNNLFGEILGMLKDNSIDNFKSV